MHRLHTQWLESGKSRLKYIYETQVKAGWVESPEEYLYSSARNYSGLKGLLKALK